MAALAAWRTDAAARLGLDAGLLLPRRLIERVAETAPRDRDALAHVDGIRRWRVAALGREILEASDDRGSATTRERVDRTAGPGGEESNG
jgi:ribonuclease D